MRHVVVRFVAALAALIGLVSRVGRPATPGHPFEWDIRLSNRGRSSIGRWSNDGADVTATPFGWVSH